MNYFAVQVKTRDEAKFVALAQNVGAAGPLRLVLPRRRLHVRRQGKNRAVLAPLFPGYVFLLGTEIGPEVYWSLRRVPGFFRFLKNNHDIQPLAGVSRELLVHFLAHGEVVKKSTVVLGENDRIEVLDGPLKGLEGRIVKVDKRKGRAKIRLDMYTDVFLVDLGIEVLQKAQGAANG
ncbi:MAG: antiterminator LoaP [Spirochaetales bacterium]|jgi:transcriptional antiterminator NusG|nr:antiterminator LoaP [Spirochaetales bacterium]